MSRLSEIPTDVAEFDLRLDEGHDLALNEASAARVVKVKLLSGRQLAGHFGASTAPKLRLPVIARNPTANAALESEYASEFILASDRRPIGDHAKRLLDISVATAALVVLSPLIGMVALLIRTTMGNPVLFRQKRLG